MGLPFKRWDIMKTLLMISPLILLVWLAWHPAKIAPHKQTRLEREQAVERVWEMVRPDYSRKEVEQLPMPLNYSGDEERDN